MDIVCRPEYPTGPGRLLTPSCEPGGKSLSNSETAAQPKPRTIPGGSAAGPDLDRVGGSLELSRVQVSGEIGSPFPGQFVLPMCGLLD